MRLSGTKATAIHQYRGLGNQLWDLAGNRPSLDLPFAETKSLVDATTGTNLVDHTRASSGTYVGSDGLIKTATTNLLLQSESFASTDNTSLINVTVTTNTIAAPNNTITADNIAGSSSTNNLKYWYKSINTTTTGAYTASVYLKAGTQSAVVIRINDNTGANGAIQSINLTTGTLSGSSIAQGTATGASASISSIGDGWYRCSITCTFNSPITLIQGPAIFHDAYSTSTSTSTYYSWGAQLEQSSTVGEYVKTTSTINSAPRFDHDPTTGESLGLLVEESRTNLLTYSEEFNQSLSWLEQGIVSIANQATAPDGTATADLLKEYTTTAPHGTLDTSASGVSGTIYTFSVYVKPDTATAVQLLGRGACFSADSYANFNLATGSLGTVGSAATAIIENAGNGWYRCIVTATATGTATGAWAIALINSDDTLGRYAAYAGTGQQLYLWGAQNEAGSFPTSYIPTEGSAVTRAADVASISGSNFSSWYRQDEGTVFADYNVYAPSGSYSAAEISDGTSNNRMILFHTAGGSARFLTFVGGSAVVTTLDRTAAAASKWTGAYKAGDYGSTYNTNAALTNTYNGTITGSQIRIGSSVTGSKFAGHIRRLTYWPTRLPNETLQQITQ